MRRIRLGSVSVLAMGKALRLSWHGKGPGQEAAPRPGSREGLTLKGSLMTIIRLNTASRTKLQKEGTSLMHCHFCGAPAPPFGQGACPFCAVPAYPGFSSTPKEPDLSSSGVLIQIAEELMDQVVSLSDSALMLELHRRLIQNPRLRPAVRHLLSAVESLKEAKPKA